MPLKKGSSKAAKSYNFRELKKANSSKPAGKKRSQKQIVAIVLNQSRKGK